MKKILLSTALLSASITAQANLLITGVIDGPLTGGLPKAVELYVTSDITDLSAYGLGSANNGGGTNGQEFTFAAEPAFAGQYIYIASEAPGFTAFFGFAPDATSVAMAINGDDAIELFYNGVVIDLFGEIDVDGSGQAWDYLDGWAYRRDGAPATFAFDSAAWHYSGINALDNATDNATATVPFPLASYVAQASPTPLPSPSPSPTPSPTPTPEVIQRISAVQGNPDSYGSNSFGDTDVSPLIGQVVSVRAVVVGDFQDGDADTLRNLQGFYLQEEIEDEDGDPRSSEGLFVFYPSGAVDVALGDLVQVRGTVAQYFGETQLSNVSAVQILASDQLAAVRAAAISLGDSAVTRNQNGQYQPDLEAYEGMLVQFTDTLMISEQFQLDRFNEIKLVAGERPYQFTQLNSPDPIAYDAYQRSLGARRITYDDGLNSQNVSINALDGFATYNEASAKRMGDSITGLSGVLDYKWAGNSASGATWRVRAHVDGANVFTSTATGTSANPRPLIPELPAGNLKLTSFNVLNFFHTLNQAGAQTAIGMAPRGANSAAEFDRQLAKTVNAMLAIDADIFALNEIENEFDTLNDGSTAIEVLVNALNTALGAAVYDYVYPGRRFAGDDAIAVAFIYKPAVVSLVAASQPALLDDSVAATLPGFENRDFSSDPIFTGVATSRVPVAVSFTHLATGEVFTAVANHLKSKGQSDLQDSTSPNFDRGDGAGFWNQRRLDAVTALRAWLATHPTGIADDDVILLGDFNAYAAEDPVQYLLSNGFTSVEHPEAYSYVFDGQLGTLDYIFIADALIDRFSGAAVWHINADEADALDYNLDFGKDASYFDGSTATRNSDHDPLTLGLAFSAPLPGVVVLVDQLHEAITNGTIYGRSRIALLRWLQELLYVSVVESAAWYESRGDVRRMCEKLVAAEDLADGDPAPADLVQGPGLLAFKQQLVQVREARCVAY